MRDKNNQKYTIFLFQHRLFICIVARNSLHELCKLRRWLICLILLDQSIAPLIAVARISSKRYRVFLPNDNCSVFWYGGKCMLIYMCKSTDITDMAKCWIGVERDNDLFGRHPAILYLLPDHCCSITVANDNFLFIKVDRWYGVDCTFVHQVCLWSVVRSAKDHFHLVAIWLLARQSWVDDHLLFFELRQSNLYVCV